MKQVEPRISGVETYSVEGTPADSVILGLQLVNHNGIDLVVAGINEGVNLGNDVYISGTLGAALQGHFYGVAAIAISSALYESKVRFEAAARMGYLLAKRIKEKTLPERTLLNVNMPHLSIEKIQSVELTRPGRRTYHDNIEKGNDGKRDYYWIVRGEPVWEEKPGTDIWAIKNKRASITPLPVDRYRFDTHPLKEICADLLDELKR